MSQHNFWYGITPIEISAPLIPEKISKLCAFGSEFLILGYDQHLYQSFTTENKSFRFHKINNVSAIDISKYKDFLYYIDAHGRLYKTDISFENIEEIVVNEEAKRCPHGFKSSSSKVKFRNIVSSEYGLLLISSDGQLWGMGVMPQIGLETTSIKKILFFEGRTVYSASIGENFCAVIARRNVKLLENCETDSDENEDVFASNCSQCQTIIGLASPASVPSLSETCPLGVEISKCSEDSSSTTAPQTDLHIDAHSFTEGSSPSSEESKLPIQNNSQPENDITLDAYTHLDHALNAVSNPEHIDNHKAGADKLNNIFINTDAARQFLSKQLSWVSASEDYIVEYTEKPTRIFKENVSNLTNLVYESVKTVGDKVVTLSRHVSGSSDNNDVLELKLKYNNEENCLLMNSCTSNYLKDEINLSSSTISTDKENDGIKVIENINDMCKLGKNILSTELWTWGDINHGQLGYGDNIKRVKPMVVITLSGFGIQKVSCGKWHCTVLTLDGRLFMWGYNTFHQVSFDSRIDKSGPKQFTENSDNDRIRDMAASDHHTVILTQNKNIYYMGKHSEGFTENIVKVSQNHNNDTGNIVKCKEKEFKKINKLHNTCYHWRILSSDNLSCCCIDGSLKSSRFQDLSIVQKYLEEMILINHSLIKPFLKKSKAITTHSNVYEITCDLFIDILNITALNVQSVWQYAENHIGVCDISLLKNLDEYIYLYKKYCSALSNLIVIGGFAQINSIVDVPTTIYNLFSDQLPSNKLKNKKTSEVIIGLAFVQPLIRLSSYKCIIQSLLRSKSLQINNDEKPGVDEWLWKVVSILDNLIDEQEKKRKDAEITRLFWETVGKNLEQFRMPERRIIRESKSRPMNLMTPGRFSSHWFLLFNNLFLHINGNNINVHPLETLWIDSLTNSDSIQNVIQLITPEGIISVSTPTGEDKTDWMNALNNSIKSVLNKESAFKPSSIRTACYTFSTKNIFYKEAKYTGRWLDGKLHGSGKLEWPDGKFYIGQFQCNNLCGFGKMEMPSTGIYEGQWKDNLQNGHGIMKYTNGDIYEGYFKDGQPHGHGVKKQGDFTSSSAAIYTGEWVTGVKQGYGVMDDIGKGEKYLGNWADNKKHGCGLIVTLDGIYYEGLFMQDVLTGHGIMVFEDGTHYEGEFRSAGVFSGKGILTFSSGDKIEGSLNGAWTEGVKISNATMQLNVSDPAPQSNSKPDSFGKLSVAPNQKWNALFKHCYKCLGISESAITPNGNNSTGSGSAQTIDNTKVWQNVAVAISGSHKNKTKTSSKFKQLVKIESVDCLEVIPQFGQTDLTEDDYADVKNYLQNACESTHHPLGLLVHCLTNSFNTTYGGVRVHPLLLSHAVKELKSITSRLYRVVRVLFPALPEDGAVLTHEKSDNDTLIDSEIISAECLLQASLLPRVHPALFVLYALHNKIEDDLYWRRLLKWNRQTDAALMPFLGIHQKFWISLHDPLSSPTKEPMFQEAVETLQQLKTTFSPVEKLHVIRSTFEKMTTAVHKELGADYLWSMDELFPVFHFVVVRARILQLGSEIHFVEDFLEPGMQNGELGLMFTTLKACYFQILQEKLS